MRLFKKLVFYVPVEHCETVKEAVFAAGAGKIGDYDHCCWQTEGVGQFRGLAGSDPFVGERGEVHRELEMKVEMVCGEEVADAVVAALRESHPYEEPAFQIWTIEG